MVFDAVIAICILILTGVRLAMEYSTALKNRQLPHISLPSPLAISPGLQGFLMISNGIAIGLGSICLPILVLLVGTIDNLPGVIEHLQFSLFFLPLSWEMPYMVFFFCFYFYYGIIGLVAVGTLGKYRTPALMTPLKDPVLVDRWPYTRARHPIYSTFIMQTVCTGFLFQNWLVLASAVGLGILIRLASHEEQWLEAHILSYREYKVQTKKFWWI